MPSINKVDPSRPDDANPEWTENDFSRAKPGWQVFEELGMEPPRGRAKLDNPKVSTTVMLDPDVIAALKAAGEGWQTRLNAKLREALGL
jgi:uncharacterized protein (DUF4415 family)